MKGVRLDGVTICRAGTYTGRREKAGADIFPQGKKNLTEKRLGIVRGGLEKLGKLKEQKSVPVTNEDGSIGDIGEYADELCEQADTEGN